MEGSFSVTRKAIENLRQLRRHASNIQRKQAKLDEVNAGIAQDDIRIKALLKEFEALDPEDDGQEQRNQFDQISGQLEKFDELKMTLEEELNTHKSNLLFFRERLEVDLWHDLTQSGQLNDERSVSDEASNSPRTSLVRSCQSVQSYQTHPDKQSTPYDRPASLGDRTSNGQGEQMRRAESLLFAAKEDLEKARMSFNYLDRLCETQRQQFETGAIPEWDEMSRTEFDLEQLAQKIEHTRELIRAERAYSEAGRHALELGLVRHDSDQSRRFVDYPGDGTVSGDRVALFVDEKKQHSIEAWRDIIVAGGTDSPVSAKGDHWEVNTVEFGESSSTHADEWEKARINEWEGVRDELRAKVRAEANATFGDEVPAQRSPLFGCEGPPSASIVPLKRSAEGDILGAGAWKPSLATMKELLVSGQVAMAKISATWTAR